MTNTLHQQAFNLARQHGNAIYCFSASRLEQARRAFGQFTDSLPLPAQTYYSYKTNYLPELCSQLALSGIGAEVTSLREWQLARTLHPSEAIVVNGIGKAGGLLQAALSDGPVRLINLETDTEVDQVCDTDRGVPHPVGLRVRFSDLTGEYGSDPSEGWHRGTLKFGWPAEGEYVLAAAARLHKSPAVQFEALHLQLGGGQLVHAATFDKLLARVCLLLDRFNEIGIRVSTLDLGGGLASGWVAKRRLGPLFRLAQAAGVPLQADIQQEPDLPGIAAALHQYARRLRDLGVSSLLFEPGRFMAEPSMMAVARVIGIRREVDRIVAVLDVGTNALHCWRSDETRPIHFEESGTVSTCECVLVGPLCHRDDTFGRVEAPADIAEGDLVILDAVGAYSLGDWIANAWDRPATYHLEEGRLLQPSEAPARHFGLLSNTPSAL